MRLDGLGAARAIVPLANQVWLGGDGGLYVSEDFGETWAPVSLDAAGIRWPAAVALAAVADPTVFAGTGDGLLRSRDGGKSFEPTALSGTAVHRLEWPGPALVVACDRGRAGRRSDEGARFSGPGQGLPAGPGARDGALVVLRGGPGAVRRARVRRRLPLVGRRGDAGRRRASTARRWATSCGWGRSSTRRAERGFYRSQDAGASWTRLAASPGRPSRLMFPLAPARGPRGVPGHRPGPVPDADAGEHWEPAGFAGQDVLTVATFPPPEPTRAAKRAAMRFAKAHGLGNDFILVAPPRRRRPRSSPRGPCACAIATAASAATASCCTRATPDGVSFRLMNADGLRGRDLGQRPALPGRARRAAAAGPRRATW